MLLTSSQVSVALSSGIVLFFTVVLFVSGYILQQQTVHSLQSVIKPRIPSPRIPTARATQITDPRARSSRRLLSWRHADPEAQLAKAEVDWNKLAYVQVVKRHRDVCSAVMLFGELVRTKSPGQRVLLVPKSWFFDGEKEDPRMTTTKRLLRKAARTFRVTLVPMDPVTDGMDGGDEASYSVASVFGLSSYERLVLLKTPGVFINSAPMDAVLAFSKPSSAVTALATEDDGPAFLGFPLLIRPSKTEYTRLNQLAKESQAATSDELLLRSAFSDIPHVLSLDYFKDASGDYQPLLYTTTDSLTQYLPEAASQPDGAEFVAQPFNATAFMREAALIRLWDASLPGPEYDVPYNVRAAAVPKHRGARRVWERTYESFRARRQEVCGLDLEPWSESERRTELR